MTAATELSSKPGASSRGPAKARDRQLLWVLLVSAAVLLPRSLIITHVQSERTDDEYHILRGAQFLADGFTHTKNIILNDPPVGEAITVLPLWLAKCWPSRGPRVGSSIW